MNGDLGEGIFQETYPFQHSADSDMDVAHSALRKASRSGPFREQCRQKLQEHPFENSVFQLDE